MQQVFQKIKTTIIRIIIFFVLGIGLAEAVLPLFIDFPDKFLIATPNSSFSWPINTKHTPGITIDTALVNYNSIGARSAEIPSSCEHKIIAIGGSTTACYALNQDKTWTYLLNNYLNSEKYWLGNFGRPGNNSNHHIYQTEEILSLAELEDTEIALFLIGVNDFACFITSENKYLNQAPYKTQLAAFAHVPDTILPWYRRLAIFKLLKRIKLKIQQENSSADLGTALEKLRKERLNMPRLDSIPDLTIALAHYRKNLKKIITVCKNKKVQPVFMTQASMWKNNLNPKYDSLLLSYQVYYPGLSKSYCLSNSALEKGMIAFNQQLKKVCKEEKVLLIDLESVIPKSTQSFYDDCHFNESGAQLVAQEVYSFLKRKGIINASD